MFIDRRQNKDKKRNVFALETQKLNVADKLRVAFKKVRQYLLPFFANEYFYTAWRL